MPQFNFRLEAPLRLAERELENERRHLAKEIEILHQKQRLCEDKEQQWQRALEGQREASSREPERLGIWQAYGVKLLQQLRILQRESALQEKVVEEQRIRVKSAHQEQEKLTKLKEKQEAAFWLKEQRREQNALDEAGQVIFIRKMEQQKSKIEDGTY
jgi:flagellar FliJ protein